MPGLASGYEARARLLLSLQRYEPALDDASKLVALGPESEQSGRMLRAGILAAAGRHDLALAEYNEVVARSGKTWQVLARRGSAFAAVGDDDRAFADVDEALRIGEREFRSGQVPGRGYDPGRGYYVVVTGDPKSDTSRLGAALDLTTAFDIRGRIWLQRGRHEQALADLDRAGSSGDALAHRGLTKLALGMCSNGYDDLGCAARDMKRELKHVLAPHQAFIQRTKCAGYSP